MKWRSGEAHGLVIIDAGATGVICGVLAAAAAVDLACILGMGVGVGVGVGAMGVVSFSL